MNPKYVTSLELSKQLKEAGVKNESEYCYIDDGYKYLHWVSECSHTEEKKLIPAFHVGELGEMLPSLVEKEGKKYRVQIWINSTGEIGIRLVEEWGNNLVVIAFIENEAEARGKMLLYLKQNKLLEEKV